jgi:hypothetical protein
MTSSNSVWNWSSTAATNATADPGINFAEGQTPGSLNDSCRAVMASVAKFVADISSGVVTGGTTSAYTLTTNSVFTTLATGITTGFKCNASCVAGPITINVDGLGAKSLRKFTSSGEVDLSAGDIKTNGHYLIQYDAAANSAAGAWILFWPENVVSGEISDASSIGLAVLTAANQAAAQSAIGVTGTPTIPNNTALTNISGSTAAPVSNQVTGPVIASATITGSNIAAATVTNSNLAAVMAAGALQANTSGKLLTTDGVWTDAGEVAKGNTGATLTLDMSTGFNFTCTANQNFTLANPTNLKVGQSGYIKITQDATGSRTISMGGNWYRSAGGGGGAGAPTLGAANQVDILFYQITGSSQIIWSQGKLY